MQLKNEISDLSFPWNLVCQQMNFMQEIFPDFVHARIDRGTP